MGGVGLDDMLEVSSILDVTCWMSWPITGCRPKRVKQKRVPGSKAGQMDVARSGLGLLLSSSGGGVAVAPPPPLPRSRGWANAAALPSFPMASLAREREGRKLATKGALWVVDVVVGLTGGWVCRVDERGVRVRVCVSIRSERVGGFAHWAAETRDVQRIPSTRHPHHHQGTNATPPASMHARRVPLDMWGRAFGLQSVPQDERGGFSTDVP